MSSEARGGRDGRAGTDAPRREKFARFIAFAAAAGRAFDGRAESRFLRAWHRTTPGTPEAERFALVVLQLDALAPSQGTARGVPVPVTPGRRRPVPPPTAGLPLWASVARSPTRAGGNPGVQAWPTTTRSTRVRSWSFTRCG